jgi:outer membrane protein
MAKREAGIDVGASAQIGGAWGIAFAEALHDVSAASHGNELRLGYRYPWRSGRLWLRPHVQIGIRDGKLNDYYYGVRPDEATAARPAYTAKGGIAPEIGLYAAYNLTERMRIIGGYTITRWPGAISASPVVDTRTTRQLTLGLMYDLTPDQEAWPERRPLIARIYNGDSSDCNVAHIAMLRCTTTHTRDRTGVAGFEIGRPFIDRLNGWPVDLAGFVGVQRHREEGFQPDFWSVRAYVKSWFYGFPWDERLRTRIGLGIGLSYAQRIPQMEVRDQAQRGRNTSKLLNTFDPTVDFSVGDLLRIRELRETYLGIGVSHRSGIFGTSQVLGNVNGGSNYIYSYMETTF